MAPLFSPPLNPLAATQVADTFRLFNIQQIQPALGYFNYSRPPPYPFFKRRNVVWFQ